MAIRQDTKPKLPQSPHVTDKVTFTCHHEQIRILVGKPEGRRPLERPTRRWEDGIKMDLREIGLGVWSGFTWLRIGTVGGLL
jgi:hypothetical protein